MKIKPGKYKIWSPIRNRKLVTYDLCEPLKYGREIRFLIKADLFHDDVPNEWIDRIFAVMALAPQHTFQILTKRPERMLTYFSAYYASTVELPRAQLAVDRCAAEMNGGSFHAKGWPLPNVWLGVSCEDQKTADERIPLLLQTPAAIRWISYEPALGPVDFSHQGSKGLAIHREAKTVRVQIGSGRYPGQIYDRPGREYARLSVPQIDWLVLGGESGPGARPFDIQWARDVIRQIGYIVEDEAKRMTIGNRTISQSDVISEVGRFLCELAACPFCGSDAKTIQADDDLWYVSCDDGICSCELGNCGFDPRGASQGFYYTEKEAIEAWNTRK